MRFVAGIVACSFGTVVTGSSSPTLAELRSISNDSNGDDIHTGRMSPERRMMRRSPKHFEEYHSVTEDLGVVGMGKRLLNKIRSFTKSPMTVAERVSPTVDTVVPGMTRLRMMRSAGGRIPTIVMQVDGKRVPMVFDTSLTGLSQRNFGFVIGEIGVLEEQRLESIDGEFVSILFESDVPMSIESGVYARPIEWLDDTMFADNGVNAIGVLASARDSNFVKTIEQIHILPSTESTEATMFFGGDNPLIEASEFSYGPTQDGSDQWVLHALLDNTHNILVVIDTSMDDYIQASTALLKKMKSTSVTLGLVENVDIEVITQAVKPSSKNIPKGDVVVIGIQFLQRHQLALHLDNWKNRIGFAPVPSHL
jgi:hypothetical protein